MRWDRQSRLIVKAIVLSGGTSADAARELKISKRAASKAAKGMGLSFGPSNACPIGSLGGSLGVRA